MPRFRGAGDFQHHNPPAVGILISNLGTPDAPTTGAVRRYLAEFLSDPRVVEVPRPIWWLVLHGIILRTRPRRSARAYQKIWTAEGSPLLIHTRRQAERLQQRLEHVFAAPLVVKAGMRYGSPSIGQALQAFAEANVTKLLVLPMYPQYSATTTASTFDETTRQLANYRRVPELRFVDSYHDRPGYISALTSSIREQGVNYQPTHRLLFSFHGIPQRYLLSGDPYHCQCHKTARLVAEQLGLADNAWGISFQSRLGREEWLRPYTDEVLSRWATDGVANVDVICPGFAADCLETLEEVKLQYRDLFLGAGGKQLAYIDALNERADHIEFLTGLITAATVDWHSYYASDVELARTRERALRLGAQI